MWGRPGISFHEEKIRSSRRARWAERRAGRPAPPRGRSGGHARRDPPRRSRRGGGLGKTGAETVHARWRWRGLPHADRIHERGGAHAHRHQNDPLREYLFCPHGEDPARTGDGRLVPSLSRSGRSGRAAGAPAKKNQDRDQGAGAADRRRWFKNAGASLVSPAGRAGARRSDPERRRDGYDGGPAQRG